MDMTHEAKCLWQTKAPGNDAFAHYQVPYLTVKYCVLFVVVLLI